MEKRTITTSALAANILTRAISNLKSAISYEPKCKCGWRDPRLYFWRKTYEERASAKIALARQLFEGLPVNQRIVGIYAGKDTVLLPTISAADIEKRAHDYIEGSWQWNIFQEFLITAPERPKKRLFLFSVSENL